MVILFDLELLQELLIILEKQHNQHYHHSQYLSGQCNKNQLAFVAFTYTVILCIGTSF